MYEITNINLAVFIKTSGCVNMEGKIEKVDFNLPRNMHLKRVKQQFLISLLKKLDYDLNTWTIKMF